MNDYGHWTSCVGKFDPADWFGMIYCIKSKVDGRSYIGKKNFTLKKRAKPLKGKTRSRISYVDSEWKTYCSSSKELQADIEKHGKDQFTFTIVRLCSGRCELAYAEQAIQFDLDVLMARLPNGTRTFYNGTIGAKNFAGIEKQTKESKRKMLGCLSPR